MDIKIAIKILATAATLVALTIASTPVLAAKKAAQQHSVRPMFRVVRTFSHVGPTPHFAGVDERLAKLFVSNLAAGTVTAVNAQTGAPIAVIHIGGTLHTVVVDEKTQQVFVTDIQRGLLDVINARTDKVEAEIRVGAMPHGLAVSNRLHRAYVSSIGTSAVDVVDLKTLRMIAAIPVGPNPWGVAVNPVTRQVFSANTGITPTSKAMNPKGDSVSIINASTDRVVKTVPVGPHPWNILEDPKTGLVYTGVSGADEVAVLRDGKVAARIPTGKSPHGLMLDGRAHRLFVNDSLSNQTTVIDTKDNRVTQTVSVGTQPQGGAVNPKRQTVYVVNQGSATVSVLVPTKRK